MFEDKETLIGQLGSPLNIANMALKELESRLGGDSIVADPNSAFCFLLEFGSSIAANCVNKIDGTLPILYPKRAVDFEDLYRHMSDFDYLRMYASPATTTVVLALPKMYLLQKAKDFNTNYRKITIPKDTKFLIGKYNFGIHYPIDILINKNTNTFLVQYDTTESNPLQILTTNILNKYDIERNGVGYLTIEIPVYQFSKSVIEETLIKEIGFIKKFAYNNRFYAIRIFYKQGDVYHEFNQTQSESIYDVTVPTAVVRVLPDEQNVKVFIPQVYLDSMDLGEAIYIELYTTIGELDINTSNIQGSSIQINFGTKTKDSNSYSSILAAIPSDWVIAIKNGVNISGGSNQIDMETLRNRVVNNTLYESVPITEKQVEVYLDDNGFTAKKYLDNVTQRIWHAYRILTDANGRVIPSRTAQLMMLEEYIDSCSSFIRTSDGSFTLLPSALYKYKDSGDYVVPLTDEEVSKIASMSKAELANTLNSTTHFKTPFHVRLVLDDYYPKAISFNLMTPKINKLLFDGENYNLPSKMMTYDAAIVHLESGTGGYRLRLSVYKSDDIIDLDRSYLKIYVSVKTVNNIWIGGEATYFCSTADRDIYELMIVTNYRLTEAEEIGVTNLTSPSYPLSEYMINLTSDFHVTYLIARSAVTGSYSDAESSLTVGVPSDLLSNYVGIARQHLEIQLGYSLDSVINHEIEIGVTSQSYATYDTDVVMTYEADEYARKPDGTLAYTITTDDETGEQHVNLTVAHKKGEVMEDEAGNTIYRHRAGDIIYDAYGNPEVANVRAQVYYVDMIFIDAKVFASERTAEQSFVDDLYKTMERYFTTLKNLQDQLLEQNYVYLRVVRSTGNTKFNLGNGVMSSQNIEMNFKLNCYVQSYVMRDEAIQATITSQICEAINAAIVTKEINMVDILASVQAKLSDYIDHFDALGINGNSALQTFIIQDEDAQPSLKRELVLSDDDVLSLEDAIDITFVALNDNAAVTSISV